MKYVNKFKVILKNFKNIVIVCLIFKLNVEFILFNRD